jgi:hypothetical protein
MVDTKVSKTFDLNRSCGFESLSRHNNKMVDLPAGRQAQGSQKPSILTGHGGSTPPSAPRKRGTGIGASVIL